MVGINSIGAFLTDDNSASVAAIVRHINHIAQLVGPEHVGLGLDVIFYQPFMIKLYNSGPLMSQRGYPRPPWADVEPEVLSELVEALDRHGYSEAAILGVLGGEFHPSRRAELALRPFISSVGT